jgi:hypothetical protein
MHHNGTTTPRASGSLIRTHTASGGLQRTNAPSSRAGAKFTCHRAAPTTIAWAVAATVSLRCTVLHFDGVYQTCSVCDLRLQWSMEDSSQRHFLHAFGRFRTILAMRMGKLNAMQASNQPGEHRLLLVLQRLSNSTVVKIRSSALPWMQWTCIRGCNGLASERGMMSTRPAYPSWFAPNSNCLRFPVLLVIFVVQWLPQLVGIAKERSFVVLVDGDCRLVVFS